MSWSYNQMVGVLNQMLETNHKDFVKALLTVEHGIQNPFLIEQIYQDYMGNDSMTLLNDGFQDDIWRLNQMIKDDITDLMSELAQTKTGSLFISEVILTNSIEETIQDYDFLSDKDYDIVSLKTLEDIIQHQLPILSDNFYRDLLILSYQKDLIDLSNNVLQTYVTNQLDHNRHIKDQENLVLE